MYGFRLAKLLALLTLLAVVSGLSACTSSESRALVHPQFPGTQWSLVSFGPTTEPAPVSPATKLTLAFEEEGKLSGSAGCNNFSGTYTVDGNKLAVSRLASTLKACADPNLMAQETRYLAALQKASGYQLDEAGRTLRIDYDGDKGMLYFARGPAE
ncbi:MAG: META domain-containing protein [Chloroflexi bacterium]|nr:META domain-containing protein [Chloroflexota bacterium]